MSQPSGETGTGACAAKVAAASIIPLARSEIDKGCDIIMGRHLFARRKPSILTMCLGDGKPYMILKALDESYRNHIGFAIIRARGEAHWLSLNDATAGPSAARRKAVDRQTDSGFRIDQIGPSSQTNHLRIL